MGASRQSLISCGCLLLLGSCDAKADPQRDASIRDASTPVEDASRDGSVPAVEDAGEPDAGPHLAPATVRVLSAEEVAPRHDGEGARAGDYRLENGLVSFTIAGPAVHDSYMPYAGFVVDGALLSEAGLQPYDGIGEITPQVNGCALEPREITMSNDGVARLHVKGIEAPIPHTMNLVGTQPAPEGLLLEVDYALAPGSPALAITTTVQNPNAHEVHVIVGDFANLDSDEASGISLPRGHIYASTDSQVNALGMAHETQPWVLLMHAGGDTMHMPANVALSRIMGEDGGLWQYGLAPAILAPGASLSRTRYVVLARDSATARAHQLDVLGQPTQTVRGHVRASGAPLAGARVSFFDADDAASFVGQAITLSDGSFRASLPYGSYLAIASGRNHGQHVDTPGRIFALAEGVNASGAEQFTLAGDQAATFDFALTASASVMLRTRNGDGEPVPAKISFIAEHALPAPLTVVGEREPYPNERIAFVFWTLDGDVEARVPPGRYRVVASRGPFHELAEQTLDIGPDTQSIDFVLSPVRREPGWVALDSHLHATDSQHGNATRSERIITALAEGLDVMVNTEHDVLVDYAPFVAALGVSDMLLPIPGVEYSGLNNHHHNLWPLVPRPDLPRRGALRFFDVPTLDNVYDHYAAFGAQIFQINHGLQTFTDAGFDFATGQVNEGSDFSFRANAMELQNGKRPTSREKLVPIWHALLNHGHRLAPLGASDSHARIPEPGAARTYVWLGEAPVTQENVARAVAASRTVASTGPLAFVRSLDGTKGPGDTLAVTAAQPVPLHVEVMGAGWLGVTEARLLENGVVLESWSLADGTLARDLQVTPSGDTWYAVEVKGDTSLAPVYPNSTAWAHSAPLWIDVE